jgi:two-component system CitB family sensor kinase/two-component system sensor histidine kinase DcuS
MFFSLLDKIRPKSLRSHLIHMVVLLLALEIGVGWLILAGPVTDILEQEIGEGALETAKAIALMPTIRRALIAQDPYGEIQELAESIRESTGASYVVVGDTSTTRYSHPKPDRIGKHFVGGDTDLALEEGRAYISQAVGTLGPSLRGIAPVRDYNGKTIGFVAVGFLATNIHEAIPSHLNKPFTLITAMLLVGIASAFIVTRHLKKVTLGLEPSEITSLYLERGVVLEAIREGVVAIDAEAKVRLVNKAAFFHAGVESDRVGKDRNIDSVLPGAGLRRALRTGDAEYDQERVVNGKDMIFNIVPVMRNNTPEGVVATFRPKDELDNLAGELSRVQEYSELLRVQTHEYSNKLHTIAGLMQIEAYNEAIELVASEAYGYEEVIRFLGEAVPHPVIAAILLGKFNRAKELRIGLDIDREGSMTDVPGWIPQEKIVTIVGNLIDNAFDAVLEKDVGYRLVELSFTDLGNDIVFEIEDSGPGVPFEEIDRIFEKGISSKGKDRRGVGLYLVRQRVDELGGHIFVDESNLGGALFTVTIPKQEFWGRG